jgi:hypothetical protein
VVGTIASTWARPRLRLALKLSAGLGSSRATRVCSRSPGIRSPLSAPISEQAPLQALEKGAEFGLPEFAASALAFVHPDLDPTSKVRVVVCLRASSEAFVQSVCYGAEQL